MCRPSSLVFVALCITFVYCKPAVPEDELVASPRALIGDPQFMASFLEFLQKQMAGEATTAAPIEVRPTVWVPQPTETITVPTPTVNPVQIVPNPEENSTVQQWGNVRIVTHPRTNIATPELLTPEQRRTQAMNAKYRYSAYVDDDIKGSFLSRAEVRDGLKTTGQYGYDDGFINRLVSYIADEQGFRIVRDETKPSTKTGKPDGTARVQIIQDNTQVDYNIANKDISTPTRSLV